MSGRVGIIDAQEASEKLEVRDKDVRERDPRRSFGETFRQQRLEEIQSNFASLLSLNHTKE